MVLAIRHKSHPTILFVLGFVGGFFFGTINLEAKKASEQKAHPQKPHPHADHGVTETIPSAAQDPRAHEGAQQRVYFIEPKDGATVATQFKVKFGVEGMRVVAATPDTLNDHSGHYHIIVNGPSMGSGTVIPKDEKHLHFGGGQKEAEMTLAPGTHKLTLQFADSAHRSMGETMSSTITVHVK